jgi:hypothetical protein
MMLARARGHRELASRGSRRVPGRSCTSGRRWRVRVRRPDSRSRRAAGGGRFQRRLRCRPRSGRWRRVWRPRALAGRPGEPHRGGRRVAPGWTVSRSWGRAGDRSFSGCPTRLVGRRRARHASLVTVGSQRTESGRRLRLLRRCRSRRPRRDAQRRRGGSRRRPRDVSRYRLCSRLRPGTGGRRIGPRL